MRWGFAVREEFLDPEVSDPEDASLEIGIRPRKLGDFVGQRELKEHLDIVLEAARLRQQAADHILLSGPPGLGKTTMAGIVAAEMSATLHVTSGPALERAGDLAAILTKLEEHDVLFIDEIHRLRAMSKRSCTRQWKIFRSTSSLARVLPPRRFD